MEEVQLKYLTLVKGMSDLLAPVLVVMENEVDAFWCFAGFMELIGRNFEMDQSSMKKQMDEVNSPLPIFTSFAIIAILIQARGQQRGDQFDYFDLSCNDRP